MSAQSLLFASEFGFAQVQVGHIGRDLRAAGLDLGLGDTTRGREPLGGTGAWRGENPVIRRGKTSRAYSAIAVYLSLERQGVGFGTDHGDRFFGFGAIFAGRTRRIPQICVRAGSSRFSRACRTASPPTLHAADWGESASVSPVSYPFLATLLACLPQIALRVAAQRRFRSFL